MPDPSPDRQQVTALLERLNDGDEHASDELLPLVYGELHRVAERLFAAERTGHTLQPTAVVHEAFLRILGPEHEPADWHGRRHFFSVAATAMRRVLIDHARKHKAAKRDGARVTLAEDVGGDDAGFDLVDLGDALDGLSAVDERVARVVELRVLGGMTMKEVAQELRVTERTVYFDWRSGRAWLRKLLGVDGPNAAQGAEAGA